MIFRRSHADEFGFDRLAALLALAAAALLSGCSGDAAGSADGSGANSGNKGSVTINLNGDSAKPEEKYDGPVWFDVVEDTGIDFVHNNGNTKMRPFPAANGSGIGAFDFDLDGQLDLYFLTGRKLPIREEESPPFNRLYRNRGGWKFEDVSAASGLDLDAYSSGVAIGDYNSDGFPDVYVACCGNNALFENMGDGTFQRIPASSGADVHGFAASAAMLDINNDSHLDIFTTHYAEWNPKMLFNYPCGDVDNPQFCAPEQQAPEIDSLIQNDGQGGFVEVAKKVGVIEPKARGQGVIAADLNNDRRIDIYLGNDLDPNGLFMNTEEGVFRNETESSGVAYSGKGAEQAGMGVDSADVDGDMLMDLIVTNFEGDYNSLYINKGDDYYNDLSARMGVMSDAMPYVGWGVALVDFDLDTWCDLMVNNGHLEPNRPNANYNQPPLAYKNMGKGRFKFLGPESGPHFQIGRPGRALSIGDFDNDGDSDAVFGYQNEAPAVISNNRIQTDSKPASITVRLVGRVSNRDAIGTSFIVTTGGRSQLYQRKGGGSYLSANDPRMTIAVDGSAEAEIRWPSGFTSTVSDLHAGGRYAIVEPANADAPADVFELEPQQP